MTGGKGLGMRDLRSRCHQFTRAQCDCCMFCHYFFGSVEISSYHPNTPVVFCHFIISLHCHPVFLVDSVSLNILDAYKSSNKTWPSRCRDDSTRSN
jgi:hypothetical protein